MKNLIRSIATAARRCVHGLVRERNPWEMGTVNGRVARRNVNTGECQFILWHAVEQGHTTDYWVRFGSGHDKFFIPNTSHEAR